MLASRVAWLRRSHMERQVRRMLGDPLAGPLGVVAVQLSSEGTDLPVIDPKKPASAGRIARWADGRLRDR